MNIHEQVMASMKEMAAKYLAAGIELEMPPQSNQTLGTRYIDIEPGKMLAAEFLYNQKFTNPTRTVQGGFLGAAFDDVYGPLSYMVAECPVVTLEMSVTFIRPFTENTASIRIRAEVVSKTKTLLFLKAEAHSKAEKLIATSTSLSMILPNPVSN